MMTARKIFHCLFLVVLKTWMHFGNGHVYLESKSNSSHINEHLPELGPEFIVRVRADPQKWTNINISKNFSPEVHYHSARKKQNLRSPLQENHQVFKTKSAQSTNDLRNRSHTLTSDKIMVTSKREVQENLTAVSDEILSDCEVITNFVLDFVAIHDWDSLVIVTNEKREEENLLSVSCLRGRGLQKGAGLLGSLWQKGRRTTVISAATAKVLVHPSDMAGTRHFFLADTNASRSLLKEASKNGAMARTCWVLIASPSSVPELAQFTGELEAFVPSELYLVAYQRNGVNVSSSYRVGPRVSTVRVEEGGHWSPSEGFIEYKFLEDKVIRRRDFQGYPMFGTGVDVFDFFTSYLPEGGVSGFVGDLVTTLQHAHNFTLTYHILDGYAYGKLIGANNSWNGMVGELQNKRVDLTVSELSITAERAQVVTYTQPIRVISRKMFVATVEDTKKKILTYFRPMDLPVYACSFFSMVLMSVLLVLTDRATHALLPGRYSATPTTWSSASWCIVSAVLQQGCPTCPTALSPRIVFWFGFIISLLIYTAYSATLTSHLAVVLPASLPFSNLFELSKLSDWNAGCNQDDLFQVTASQTCAVEPRSDECQILYDVWNQNVMREPDNLVGNYTEGLLKSLEGQYVFIGVGVTTRYYLRQLPTIQACQIKELPGLYIQGGIAIGLQHNSPFQPSFDASLQKIRESGLMEKLGTKWLSKGVTCDADNLVSADIIDVSSLFILLLSGTGLSLVALVVECVLGRRKKSPDHLNIISPKPLRII